MNNDLISREALKEDLAKEIKTNDLGLWLKILSVIDNAQAVDLWQMRQEATENAMKKAREADRWIPVSERLPKEGNRAYLVTVDYGNGVIVSCQRFFYNEGIGWNDDCVIAWKPLPKPYESEDK